MIQIENLEVVKKDKAILSDINLKIGEGEKILIQGESGSGKSTLIKSILFFERFSGTIYFRNQEVGKHNLVDFRSHIGYIGQVTPNLDESVVDFFKLPFRYKSNHRLRFNQEQITKLIETLNFDDSVLDKRYNDLSVGEKQRLLILQILRLNKPIYIFDEVTASLDERNIARAIELITRNQQRTVISISHHAEWKKFSDRLIEMKLGRIFRDRSIS